MSERRDRTLHTGAAIGSGAVGLCCALPVIATLGAVTTLGFVFGLGGAVVVFALASVFVLRRREMARIDCTRTDSSRNSP